MRPFAHEESHCDSQSILKIQNWAQNMGFIVDVLIFHPFGVIILLVTLALT